MKKLVCGALIISFAPILVKAASLGPTAIAFYRCAAATMVMLVLLAVIPKMRPDRARMPDPKVLVFCLGSGLFFALDLFVWHRSLVWTGAGMGTILANTQVFYVAAIGILFYKEAVTVRFMIAVPAAFIGVYLLAAYQAPALRGENYLLGVVCGLTTGFMYTGFLVLLRKAELLLGEKGTLWNLTWMSGSAGVFLLLFALGEGTLTVPRGQDLLWLMLLGVGPQTCGWLLITAGLAEVPISKAGLVLLLQPTLATVMGALIYGERFAAVQVIGALLTIGAIYLGITRDIGRASNP
ncbi:MAG: DMT family transporter [Elusimicrobiota bacterium]